MARTVFKTVALATSGPPRAPETLASGELG